jgi:ATP-binding cassette subfamily C protein CydC
VRFFGISRAILRYLERLVSHSVNFRHLAGLRVWFFRKIEPLAPAGLVEYRSADLLNRSIADIETLENFYVRAVAPPLSALVIVAGTGWLVGRYDPRFTLLLVSALLAAGGVLPLMLYWANRSPGAELINKRAVLHGRLLDMIQGMADLLAFGQGEAQLGRIQAAGQELGRAQWRVNRNAALANTASLLLSGLALWGVLLLAIPQVGQQLSGISLAVLALVILSSFEAVLPLTQAAQHLESCIQAGQRLFALADQKPVVESPPTPHPPPLSAALRIRGLRFSYVPEAAPALDGIDLDLPPGRRVALVGPSGAGKTSLVNLLLRFWDFQQGTIEMDGVDIRQYDPEEVRKMMAVVAQPAYLFSATLRGNLLIARPGASAGELERAVHEAQLDELVRRLPQGLDTWLGDRGYQLSGGERQRVVIARALLRDSPLWILDEPTANLDAETEALILATLRQACQGKSVLTITHRLVGMEELDEILVLSRGRVIERGSHVHLLALGGTYARMWQIQQEAFG